MRRQQDIPGFIRAFAGDPVGIDAVDVCTPNDAHFEVAMAAVETSSSPLRWRATQSSTTTTPASAALASG